MAEAHAGGDLQTGQRPIHTRGMWTALLLSRLRAQMAYRASFAVDLAGNLGIALLEFTELWVIFEIGRAHV